MGIVAIDAASRAAAMMRSEAGVGSVMAELAEQANAGVPTPPAQILEQMPPAEAVAADRYPSIYVFCERLTNRLAEKGRTFSGQARMTIECRVSQDRLEGLEKSVLLMADAVGRVLSAGRGNWTAGMFHDGTYEVQYGPARKGGKNLVQTARITFDLHVSN